MSIHIGTKQAIGGCKFNLIDLFLLDNMVMAKYDVFYAVRICMLHRYLVAHIFRIGLMDKFGYSLLIKGKYSLWINLVQLIDKFGTDYR